MGGLAAFHFSRGLAYPSTGWIVGGFNCRVRSGSGWAPPLWPPKPTTMTGMMVGSWDRSTHTCLLISVCFFLCLFVVSLDFALDRNGLFGLVHYDCLSLFGLSSLVLSCLVLSGFGGVGG